MDSSSKRVLLTVIICAIIWIVWYTISPPPPPPPPPKAPDKTTTSSASKPAEALKPSQLVQAPASQPSEDAAATAARRKAGPLSRSIEGVHTTLKTKDAVATFTSSGGTIRHWVLTDQRYKEHWKGKLQQVDLVKTMKDKGPWPMVTTFSQVRLRGAP